MRGGLLLACLAAPLAAQSPVNAGMAVAPAAAIRVVAPAGALRITAWERDSVQVRGRVDPAMGRFFLTGTREAVKLGIEAPDKKPPEGSADLEILIPAQARLWVQAPDADVELTPGGGSVAVLSASGRVRVAGRAGDISVESLDGNIELTGQGRDARLRTASGTIVARGVLRELHAASVSGPLLVGMEGPVERVDLESVSGEIAFKGDLTRDGTLRAETHGGDIELRLPPDLAATFNLTAYGGGLVNDLVAPELVQPGARKGEWKFTTGPGGASVTVRTFKGKVVLRAKGR
jgi:hypothetical protein